MFYVGKLNESDKLTLIIKYLNINIIPQSNEEIKQFNG